MYLPNMIISLVLPREPPRRPRTSSHPTLEFFRPIMSASVVTLELSDARVLLVAALVGAYKYCLHLGSEMQIRGCAVWIELTYNTKDCSLSRSVTYRFRPLLEDALLIGLANSLSWILLWLLLGMGTCSSC